MVRVFEASQIGQAQKLINQLLIYHGRGLEAGVCRSKFVFSYLETIFILGFGMLYLHKWIRIVALEERHALSVETNEINWTGQLLLERRILLTGEHFGLEFFFGVLRDFF